MKRGRPEIKIIDGKKKCTKCKKNKPVEDFAEDDTLKCGYSSWCKLCKSPVIKKCNTKYPYTQESKKRQRLKAMERKYGLSEADYLKLLDSQNNRCAICTDPIDENTSCVDHCHKTNKVRGLLCLNCNLGLGHFKDKVELLRAGIKYLSLNLQKS